MRSARGLAVVLVASWLGTPVATGQVPSPTGDVYGTAVDESGNPLSGVSVTLNGPGSVQYATSNARGNFHFLGLSPGEYSFLLDRTDFESVRRNVAVALGNTVMSVVMPVAGVAETVTVSGSPDLDDRGIQTGASFNQTELEEIPTTRDPWGILRQVPGVLIEGVDVGGGRHPRQPAFVGKGSRSNQSSYNLDGVAISQDGISPLYYDFDSFTSVEVTTGGADPSLVGPGVAVNLVTKRGTNQLQGSSRVLYTGGAGWDYGIEAGGPLWSDRIWLWAAYARDAFLGQTFFAAGEPVQNQETLTHWNAKLNAELIAANTLSLSFTNFDRLSTGIAASAERSLPTTWTNVLDGQAFRAADSQIFSPNLFASFYFAYVKGAPILTPEGGLGEQADQDTEGVWRHSYSEWRLRDYQHSSGLNVTTFFDMGALRHELKFGFGYRHTRLDSASTWPGDMLIGYGPFAQAGITRPLSAKSEVNNYDAFVGDTIQTGHLTVNLGLRFDYQQGRNLPSEVPANPVFPELLPAVRYGGDTGYPITWRALQPRVGATYSLGGGRTLLRASYSRFANQLGNTVRAVNAFPTIAYLYYVWNDLNEDGRVQRSEVDLSQSAGFNGVDPANPGSNVALNRVSSDFQAPTTDEVIVGIERRISSNLTGSLAYTYRVSRNIEFSPLIGTTRADYAYLGNAAGAAVDEETGFVLDFSEPFYGLTTDPPPAGNELQNRPDANETYSGIELQLMKSLSNGWMARVSFSYNDWQQHIGRGAIVNPNNETPGTNASGPVVAGSINATWQFNVSGMVLLPFGISAGLSVFGRQGFPVVFWTDAFTYDTRDTVVPLQIGPATRYRTPNVYVADLQLSRAFPIGSTLTLTPQVACFNVLDSRTVLQREGFVGWYEIVDGERTFTEFDAFNDVTSELGGRVLRGGVRITF